VIIRHVRALLGALRERLRFRPAASSGRRRSRSGWWQRRRRSAESAYRASGISRAATRRPACLLPLRSADSFFRDARSGRLPSWIPVTTRRRRTYSGARPPIGRTCLGAGSQGGAALRSARAGRLLGAPFRGARGAGPAATSRCGAEPNPALAPTRSRAAVPVSARKLTRCARPRPSTPQNADPRLVAPASPNHHST